MKRARDYEESAAPVPCLNGERSSARTSAPTVLASRAGVCFDLAEVTAGLLWRLLARRAYPIIEMGNGVGLTSLFQERVSLPSWRQLARLLSTVVGLPDKAFAQ